MCAKYLKYLYIQDIFILSETKKEYENNFLEFSGSNIFQKCYFNLLRCFLNFVLRYFVSSIYYICMYISFLFFFLE